MSKGNDTLILKYQKLYAEDTHSRAFAPLAEAYRQEGRIEEALQICQNGIRRHPQFIGAHITLGRIYLDSKKEREACKCFIQAIQLAPENILAHGLLARCWLRLNQPQKALKSLKTVLFLNPDNEQLQEAVHKLEISTSAAPSATNNPTNSASKPHEESLLAFLPDADTSNRSNVQKLSDSSKKEKEDTSFLNLLNENHQTRTIPREMEKYLSLIDAFAQRGEHDKAFSYLEKLEEKWPQDKSVQARRKLLMQSIIGEDSFVGNKQRNTKEDKKEKIQKLEILLLKIQNKRLQLKPN